MRLSILSDGPDGCEIYLDLPITYYIPRVMRPTAFKLSSDSNTTDVQWYFGLIGSHEFREKRLNWEETLVFR